jgi:hypothetical protein
MIQLSLVGFTFIIKRHKRIWTTEEIQHEKRLKEIKDQILDRQSKVLPFM